MRSTRKEALEAKERFYFTGGICKNGHVDKRITRSGECHTCNLEYQRKHKEKYKNINWVNPE